MKDGRRIDNTWRLTAVLFTVAAIAAPAIGGQTIVYPVALNQWVRENHPDTIYGLPDTISVWSTQDDPTSDARGRRYGMLEFDVTPLAGKTLVSVELRLYQGAWDAPPNGMPMKQSSYIIATGPTSIVDLSWVAYFGEKDGSKQALEGLGKYDLPAIGGVYGFQSSFATAADLLAIQNEANGDGRLTLVMIADEDSTVYRRDWADPGWAPSHGGLPPVLVVDDGTDCAITTTSLPVGRLGTAYSATLETSAGCTGAQWTVIEGALPDGLSLEASTGVISGTPGAEGTFTFKVQMTSTVATRTASLSITIIGDLVTLTPTKDVWLRESSPNTTYENDPLSVWSDASTDQRRYGVIEFDVSLLTGLTLQSATLSLYSGGTSGPPYGYLEHPQKQTSSVFDSGGTPTGSLTWNIFDTEFKGTMVPLTRLGRYDLPANDPSQVLTYMDSQASAADLAMISAAANSSGKLRIVMMAVEDGIQYQRDWGDLEAWAQPARLTVLTGSGCLITTTWLPPASQGSYYETQLEGTPGCGSGTWAITNCFLPSGLVLNPATGLISGWPTVRGEFAFTVQLTPAGSGQPQQKDLVINVETSPADLDADGDVDLTDFDEFALEYTGPVAPATCGLTGSDSDVVVVDAAADTWIRNDGQVHENDLISVWSSANNLRYGLVTFDVSALAGQTVRSATLELYAETGGTQQPFGISQTVSIVPGTALDATWDTYMANQEPSAQLLDGLRTSMPGPKDAVYHASTSASAADLTKMVDAATANGGLLTLVMKADETGGIDYRADWGDLGYDNHPPRLRVVVGPACTITTLSLPSAAIGTPYSATLETDGGCTGTLTWQIVECQLPTGLTLDAGTGVISGTPRVTGTFPFRVQLTSAEGTRTRGLSITVGGVAKADFNLDGVVDLLDFDTFALAFTGAVGPRPFCGTVTMVSTDTPLAIPDGGNVASVITVPPGALTIGDLNVYVDITHPGKEAVQLILQSPTGTTVVLKNFGGDFGNFTPVTYDDDGSEGSTLPAEALLAFDGQSAAGNWTLTAYDMDVELVDNGVLNSWKLIITAQ